MHPWNFNSLFVNTLRCLPSVVILRPSSCPRSRREYRENGERRTHSSVIRTPGILGVFVLLCASCVLLFWHVITSHFCLISGFVSFPFREFFVLFTFWYFLQVSVLIFSCLVCFCCVVLLVRYPGLKLSVNLFFVFRVYEFALIIEGIN